MGRLYCDLPPNYDKNKDYYLQSVTKTLVCKGDDSKNHTVENLDVNTIRKDITITNNYDRSTLKQIASFFLGTIVNNDCKILKKALGMLDFLLIYLILK